MADAPKILGMAMARRADGWELQFGCITVSVSLWGSGKYQAFIEDMCAQRASSIPDCIAAIERELLKIREAIPEPSAKVET